MKKVKKKRKEINNDSPLLKRWFEEKITLELFKLLMKAGSLTERGFIGGKTC
jgi:hypothetical protein